jgi:hypothetical protein
VAAPDRSPGFSHSPWRQEAATIQKKEEEATTLLFPWSYIEKKATGQKAKSKERRHWL